MTNFDYNDDFDRDCDVDWDEYDEYLADQQELDRDYILAQQELEDFEQADEYFDHGSILYDHEYDHYDEY